MALTLFAASPACFARESSGEGTVQSYCATLLTEAVDFRTADVVGAPGLKMLVDAAAGGRLDYQSLLHATTDAYYPHELVSSAKYAKLISARKGETLLMVPDIAHRSVPGFDGLILDSSGASIANYSLKTILGAHDEHAPMDRAEVGIVKAERFSTPGSWLTMLKLFTKDQSGTLHLGHSLSPGDTSVAEKWAANAMKLFGILSASGPVRPTRVVVDIQNEENLPSDHDIAKIRDWIRRSNGLIDGVTFLKGDAVVEVRASE